MECYDKSEGKPVQVDIDLEVVEGNKPTLALLLNRSEEDEIHNNGETREGMVVIIYADQTEYLNHRKGSVVYRIFEPKLTINIFTRPTRKKHPNRD